MRPLAALIAPAIAIALPLPATAAPTAQPAMQKTASGIQYQVLRPARTKGKGPHPAATDRVQVNYRGMLADGTTFDASRYDEPATFALDEVIPGWTEGVQLMEPGAKYRFIIPPELAYGEGGAGGVIPPNATLTFDIELLAINPPE
ncbi:MULTISPECIES: FKBP-type peptidyl-prolyl cis-trans isomerase [Edaphosphingomonas]|uniref:Peptidyl-prolyl cis-trans isomerase n=2 Tax=Edaphosphingomonas TaxID=3423724 RepID=A0A2T4HMI6_9SPHN|nr:MULTISPECIES: FKBP-type peptidyl-prolyl cis-trans isomerase [Sphingomonas]OHT19734.1 putative FKBP-type peptidyl-prolyl cis-trans isomerase [Sphingomonas haloaromaticamans]PTD17024.1 peptidylprolyl isomerase [Sphingomonas fennica]